MAVDPVPMTAILFPCHSIAVNKLSRCIGKAKAKLTWVPVGCMHQSSCKVVETIDFGPYDHHNKKSHTIPCEELTLPVVQES